MARYVKKPVEVEAEQFDAKKAPWPKGVFEWGYGYWIEIFIGDSENLRKAKAKVELGDWILTFPDGDQEVWTPEDFKKIYDKVT
jgi:hypothetical protein